jgi:hypothetical protein
MAQTNQNRAAPKGGRYTRTPGASKYLKDNWGIDRAPTTLDTLRCRSGGPRFFKFNSTVVYLEDDLDDWARELLGVSLASTSEPRQAAQEPEQRRDPRHALTSEPSTA